MDDYTSIKGIVKLKVEQQTFDTQRERVGIKQMEEESSSSHEEGTLPHMEEIDEGSMLYIKYACVCSQ